MPSVIDVAPELSVRGSLADLVALVKPRIMVMALLTAAGGLSLAPGAPSFELWLTLMVGTALLVGAANTLNMYLERDVDCLMARTRNRPLPRRRLAPQAALTFGVVQAVLAVPVLTFGISPAGGFAGPLTGTLGVIALISYVMLYTPLKQRTWIATWVGALPGAMPALMGWTAATGRIDAGGLAVFALLFIWQIPHFHAIALFRHREYARAGLKTLVGEHGEAAAHREIVVYSIVQVAVSIAPWALGVAGRAYLVVAVVMGAAFLYAVARGLARGAGPAWAKRLFLLSIVYLPVVFTTLCLDGLR
ncbi:MAG: heme o synthase [Myxococcales bacterium]|nr:heme o synthase [Myxococcales bacterium]